MPAAPRSPPARPRRICLIVAMDRNRAIGYRGRLPWHLPEDLKRFKALTMGHTIIMGRKTHESIGRLLPGRRTIIVTRQSGYDQPGAHVVASIDAALAACAGEDEAFVIGGGEIYAQALPYADRLHVTEVHLSVQADAFFPPLPAGAWRETARDPHPASPPAPAYDFVVLERTPAGGT